MSGAVRWLAGVRWREVLAQQGTPVFGALFAMGGLTVDKAAALALLLTGSCCLFAHVFVFNDWSGIAGDLRDPHREPSVFLNRGFRRRDIGYLAIALLGVSLLLLAPLGLQPFCLGVGILVLSALYSAPVPHLKGVPVANSALHFAGGMLHFLLGYAAFATIDWRGCEIGAFFALTSVAGHLTHEARDWEGDRLNNIGHERRALWSASMFPCQFRLFHCGVRHLGPGWRWLESFRAQ